MPINPFKIIAQQAALPPPLTVGELVEILEPFSIVRRTAVLFALETRITPSATVLLDWSTAGRMKLSALARALLQQQVRHLRLNYVFWEYLDRGVAAPLFGLETSFPTWDLLQRRYDHILLVDTEADRIAFLNDLKNAR